MTHATQAPLRRRCWEEVVPGEQLVPLAFPLTVYRLVMAAGANRDFNSIHHNAEYARGTGATDIYANNMLLQGMWERSVRDFIGAAGVIRHLRGFRMRSFNTPGSTLWVRGEVSRKWLAPDALGWVEIRLWTENADGISVGPGSMSATLPRQGAG